MSNNGETKMHPIHLTHDGFINSYVLKRKVNILAPTQDMVSIEDIAATLSKICRWGGKGSEFFSVAQHSVLVSYIAPKKYRLAALLHDAAEAYVGDVCKPLKVQLGKTFDMIEHGFEEVICDKFKFPFSHMLSIKPADMRAAEIEFEYLFCNNGAELTRIFNSEEPCWTPKLAEEMFLSTYNELL